MSGEAATFGDLLRRLRADAALSQEELAERAGLSARGISDLERGARRVPHLHTVRLLADALGVTAGDRAILLTAARPPPPIGDAAIDEPRQWDRVPCPLTRLIGREAQIATVQALLDQDDVRLVTLTGAGGIGKTRLAVAVATAMASVFADGVVFVDLAPLHDHDAVIATIATALDVRESGPKPLAIAVANMLAPRHLLLLLDNFEHLLPAAPVIADLLQAAPGVKALVTSRQPLRLHGGREFPVPPLNLPALPALASANDLVSNEAVTLFAERARDARFHFALKDDDVPAVAQIVIRLDGLPLAIELAAARAKVLTPVALLARLEHQLPLLTGGARDAPARHHTMRNTVAWSYDLLARDEQALFRQISIFSGGCTLEAAHAITAAISHESIEALDVLERLSSLVDKSLLQVSDDLADEPRFTMLQTVREYGLERLAECDEAAVVGAAHAAYFLAMAQQAEPSFLSANEGVWLDRLEVEFDNIRAVMEGAIEQGDASLQLHLSSLLWRFLRVRGHMTEGRKWLEHAITMEKTVPPAIMRTAIFVAGLLAYHQNDYARSMTLHTELLRLSREAHDPGRAGLAQGLIGVALVDLGRYEEAVASLEEAISLLRNTTHDHWLIAVLGALGHASYQMGDQTRAVALAEEALAFSSDGSGPQHAIPLELLAAVARNLGDFQRAVDLYRRSIGLWQTPGDTWHIADCLTALAEIAASCGQPVLCVQLLAAADHLRTELGASLRPRLREIHEHAFTAVHGTLDGETFAVAWGEGAAMPLPEAILLAAQLPDFAEVASATPRKRRASAAGRAELSSRETEVLSLIADGLPDRAIADALFVSHRTVTSHVTSILSKLGVASRSAAVAFAIRQGLV